MCKKFKNKFPKTIDYFIYSTIKRVFDIVGSIIGLILLAPVFLIVSIAIKLDSKGPVYFSHKRLGKYGNIINVYKFRTMLPNAEELLDTMNEQQKKEYEVNFKLEDDPRITNIGHFLRKTSLDELPQLINILFGSLSIVGPRPIIKRELENYGVYKEQLLSVKPGLTGLWQVSGRSNTTYEERVNLDMEYIKSASLLLDIKIVLKTFIVVIEGKGAS